MKSSDPGASQSNGPRLREASAGHLQASRHPDGGTLVEDREIKGLDAVQDL
jgi:hypothetical protein